MRLALLVLLSSCAVSVDTPEQLPFPHQAPLLEPSLPPGGIGMLGHVLDAGDRVSRWSPWLQVPTILAALGLAYWLVRRRLQVTT